MSQEQPSSRVRASVWPLLAVITALLPFAAGFSTSNVFFVRDLGMYFWPRHLWLRQAWQSGESLLWDPYAAAGHSAVSDALNQFFLLPVMALRLLAPDVIGFNIWVAAPFPLMALGAWLWLRLRCSAPAAFVGAVFFSVAGPVVSAGNFPNFSWAVAMMPWILWCMERGFSGTSNRGWFLALAVCVAAQALAGEPVTLAGTCALVVVYSLTVAHAACLRERIERTVRVCLAIGAGALLSAVQLVPLGWAARHSARGHEIDATFWSLHPLAAAEMLTAHLFGHAYEGTLDRFPWMTALNSGREPLLYSLYIGAGGCLLALMAARDPDVRRWRRFWWATGAVSLVLALGEYTPVYPALQAVVPFLQSLRFPIKYVMFGVLALAALAATGADALLGHRREGTLAAPIAGICIGTGVSLLGALWGGATAFRPDWVLAVLTALGTILGMEDPPHAASWLLHPAGVSAARLAGMGLISVFLVVVVWTRHRVSPVAVAVLCGAAVVDPLAVNADLNPAMPAAQLGPPAWLDAMRADPDARVYVGGRVQRDVRGSGKRLVYTQADTFDVIDSADRFPVPAEALLTEAVTVMSVQFAYTPSAWKLRETISYDLPQLLPYEYGRMLRKLRGASREARLRFVGRTGVRYCFLDAPPHSNVQPVVEPAVTRPMALYECNPNPHRVYVTPRAITEPDIDRQLGFLFAESHDPERIAVVDREVTEAAGQPGPPGAAAATIVRDANTELVVRASAGEGGGYLNVLDSFSPYWRATVDEEPAVVLRANGLYRAVRLPPGSHEVRFTYVPVPFYAGLAVSLGTAVALVIAFLLAGVRARRGPRSARDATADVTTTSDPMLA